MSSASSPSIALARAVSARRAERRARGSRWSPARVMAIAGQTSLGRNIAVNWVQAAIAVTYAVLVTPMVVRALGAEAYGVWSFVNGLTTYADLFYLGLGTALVRYIAEYRTRNDREAMRRLCSVVFTVYMAIGALFLVAAVALGSVVPRLLAATPQSVSATTIVVACALVGARVTALFAGSVFSGIIFAHDRNDVFKGVMIAISCLRLAVIPILVRGPHGLLILAAVFTTAGWLEAFVLALYARAITGGLGIRIVAPRIADLRPLYAFGLLSFGIQISSKLIGYTDTTVIGIKLGATDVAIYTLPLQLIEYGRFTIAAIASVILPRLVMMRAAGTAKDLGPVFVRVARASCLLGAWLNVSLILLGRPFLERWVGGQFATPDADWILAWLGAASFCQILSTQVPLPFYQSLHALALPGIVLAIEAVVNLVASLLLAKPYGPVGVAFATLVPTLCVTFVILPAHICRRLELPVRTTLATVLTPSLWAAAGTAATLLLLNRLAPSASYLAIGMKGIAGMIPAAVAFAVMFPRADRDLARSVIRRIVGVGDAPAPSPTAGVLERLLGRVPASPMLTVEWKDALFGPSLEGAAAERIAVPLRIGGGTVVTRVVSCIWAGVRALAVEWTFRRSSAAVVATFAVYPDLDEPVIVYQLGSAAAVYASEYLLPAAQGRTAAMRSTFERVTGYPASAGALIVVARRG